MQFMTTKEMQITQTLLYAIKGYMVEVTYLSRGREILNITTCENTTASSLFYDLYGAILCQQMFK